MQTQRALVTLALLTAVGNLACSPHPASTTTDAGSLTDAGAPIDAGVPVDAGAPVDAGPANDAGPVNDAGPAIDAGFAGIHFGFNAKGTLNTPQQVAYTQALLQPFTPTQRANMVIRVLGCTSSQTTYPSDWTDADIQTWVDLQTATGVGLSFTVNGNDPPASQRAFYDRWVSLGAHFQFIEMMNEYYLAKYTEGNTDHHPEVTTAVTDDDYVNTILPAYFTAFSGLGQRFYVILAPATSATGMPNGNDGDGGWNDTVIGHLGSYGSVPLGVTIHLYKGPDAYDYDQIDRIAARLPAGIPIAITETGDLDPTVDDGAQYTQASVAHLAAIAAKLRPGDTVLDQVLYLKGSFPDGGIGSADLHPMYGGGSPKGQAVVDCFKDHAHP